MSSTSNINIKEIAEQLDCGYRAYIHKTTRQLLFVPDEYDLSEMELDPWNQELEELDNNPNDYYEIEKWSSREVFELMSEFTDQVSDNKLQSRLFEALRKNKPFREFKVVIDNSGEYRQQWFEFKAKWQQDFVTKQLNILNLTNE